MCVRLFPVLVPCRRDQKAIAKDSPSNSTRGNSGNKRGKDLRSPQPCCEVNFKMTHTLFTKWLPLVSSWYVNHSGSLGPQKWMLVQRHTDYLPFPGTWLFWVLLTGYWKLLAPSSFTLGLWSDSCQKIKWRVVTWMRSLKPGYSLANLEFSYYINLVENPQGRFSIYLIP